ncbi:MAG: phosphoribulokinase [Anaerolineae bacterium]|nr:phosphoribulokinase [Anaerolineae bacterium]
MPYQKTILLGVVGDSAAGKTTISAGIARILGEDRVTVICTDDYHRYNRAQRKEMGISALDPACNYMDIMEQDLDNLRRGHAILKPIYNHSTGDFDPPEYIEPTEFIIAEGLLGLHNRGLRRNFDVKVYLAPEEELRVRWKIKRDTTKRGYTPEQVRSSLEKRINDSQNFIQPQMGDADILVKFYRPNGQEEEIGEHLNVQLMLRPTLPHPNLSELVECEDNGKNGSICTSYQRQDDWLIEALDISGKIPDQKATEVEDLIWTRLQERSAKLKELCPDQYGAYTDGAETRISHPLALTQLLIVYHMLLAREELREEHRHLAQRITV